MDQRAAEAMTLPLDTTGALVIAVSKDGPAEKAGLLGSDQMIAVSGLDFEVGGDVITAIDGKAVENMDDLIAYLISDYQPGDQVELAVIHSDGTKATITVTLGKRPSADELLSLQEEPAPQDQQ